MKYIKVTDKKYVDPNVGTLNKKGQWVNGQPELYPPNLIEWFKHDILGRHFSFGQPFCVICGKEEKIIPNTTNEI